MSKSEMVKDLQEVLKELRIIATDLDSNVCSLKEVLDAEEFVSDNLADGIKKNLDEIKVKQAEFVSKFEVLDLPEFSGKYSVLEKDLSELEKLFEEDTKYIRAVEFFLRIHSADEKTERMLQDRRQVIIRKNIESLKSGELQTVAEPYYLLYKTFLEKDAKKKFSLMYKLASCFEEEIVMGLQFGTLEIKGDTDIEVQDKIVEVYQGNENGGIEDGNAEKFNHEDISDNVGLEEIIVKENPSVLHVQTSPKATLKFGVKEFKKDITKQLPNEKIECMTEALDGCGYSIKSIAAKKNDEKGVFKLATEKLFQYGYLKKYAVDGMGDFFTLSLRGRGAFAARDSLSFINQHIRGKVSVRNDWEEINDTANSAIVRLLSYNSLIKQRILTPDYQFKSRMCVLGTDYFMQGYPDYENKVSVWFAGIVTEDTEQILEFKRVVTDKIDDGDTLIISGKVLDQAKAVAKWIEKEIDTQVILERICYSAYFEDNFFDVSTGEMVLLRENKPDANDSSIVERTEVREEKNVLPEGRKVIESQEAMPKIITNVSITLTDEEKKNYFAVYQKMIISEKPYAASAYLKALIKQYPSFESIYRQLAYAVNDPMENCTYSSDTIFNVYYGEAAPVSDYFVVAAALRNYFYDQYSYDYSIQQLYAMLSGNNLLRTNQSLEKVIYDLMAFKNEQHRGVDRYADYREKERGRWEKNLAEIRHEAKGYYENFGNGNLKENASHKRFIETSKLLLGAGSDLCEYLKIVVDDDREMLDMLEDFLAQKYVKDQAVICEEGIDSAKINVVLDYYWELASQNMRLVKKTSDLMSSLRMNLYKKVYKVVSVLCNYVFVMHSSFTNTDDPALYAYKKLRTRLLNNIREAIKLLSEQSVTEINLQAGKVILSLTLEELERRLTGDYIDGSHKYYYVDFLKSDKVLLDEEFFPILEDVLELPGFSVMVRIQQHCEEDERELIDRVKCIFEGDDDYGSASLILKYLADQGYTLSEEEAEKYNIEKAVDYPLKDLENRRKEFIEDIELAQSYGQIDNTVENSKETILQIMEIWYAWAIETRNYGFFVKILKEFNEKIRDDAQTRAVDLKKSMDVYLETNKAWSEDELVSKAVSQIRERIEQQNYAAAEDLLNRLLTSDLNLDVSVQQEDYLIEFLDEYDVNYRKTANSGATLKSLVNTSKANKDIKGGNRLLENWPKGAGIGEPALKNLLYALGFTPELVKREAPIPGRIESYSVVLKRPQNGRKSNYKHPISAFGSEAEEKGFRVVCIFGKADASRLIDIFKEVGNAKNTLVLLDYALSLSDRRTLARKTKTDMSGKIFGVIDRVVLVYLAKHYTETAINRMLMSVIMPFASYQPYIDKSADVMPQEIFIGRKDELEKIESPTGVNIVYGGRQLGKSALLRMACKDIDLNENGDRAILVDIKGNDYKAAAKKISATLYDEGIFKEEHITDDWSELARTIKKRLRSDNEYIPYLLLLMDEADVFIESCESVGYQPFDALKDIQSIGLGRFKFVVAGLRNIVRFKREAALGNNSVLTHLDSLTVKPFKSVEARELLEVPLSYLGFRFPKDNETEVLISTIFGTTNYFPGLLQLYCTKLIEAMRWDYAGYSESETPPYIVKKDHIKKILAEQSLQQDIREKFFITLKVGEDDYYYIIALLVAYYYHNNKSQNGCSAKDLLELANTYSVAKIAALNAEKLVALMEEMRELNVLQHTGDDHYRFTRYSFCQMMGTVQQIDDELLNYMED